MYGNLYHNPIHRWHPRPSVFDRPIKSVRAEQAMREGDALRDMLRGRRILEAA